MKKLDSRYVCHLFSCFGIIVFSFRLATVGKYYHRLKLYLRKGNNKDILELWFSKN